MPADEQHEVEEALQNDAELAEACAEMLLARRALDHIATGPSAATTATILQYSRTFLKAG